MEIYRIKANDIYYYPSDRELYLNDEWEHIASCKVKKLCFGRFKITYYSYFGRADNKLITIILYPRGIEQIEYIKSK